MYHFIAFSWDSTNANASAEARNFRNILLGSDSDLTPMVCIDGLVVFAAQPRERALRAYVLPHDAGVVLGRLFCTRANPSATSPDVRIDEAAALRILNGGARQLVDDYWGAYIALLHDAHSRRNYVVRDCSGWIPCYRTKISEVHIFFADLQELALLSLPPFTLNHEYLAASIYYPSLHVHDCALTGITELLAGECVEMANSGVRQYPLWDPSEIVARSCIDDHHDAEDALRAATQACITSWARAYADDSVLLSLSGGLDSAIVLGCLAAAPVRPGVSCFNWCAPNTADDERRYASQAAANAGIPLIEGRWSSVEFDSRLFTAPKGPKPYPGDIYWWLERDVRNAVVLNTGANVIWTGQGGDHLFWSFPGFPIGADYIAKHGVHPRFLRVVRDTARLNGQSYVSVIKKSLELARNGCEWVPDHVKRFKGHFVNREALPSDPDAYVMHPWESSSRQLPKTKQVQISLLSEVLNRHNHLPRAEYAYQRHPLLSQPLMEVCLTIPIYLLTHGGRTRSLARDAFRDCVPRDILDRNDKGSTNARVRAMIRQNEPFLCDLLLHGILAKAGILCVAELEAILVDGQSYRPDSDWPLLACIATEVWARSFGTGALGIAA